MGFRDLMKGRRALILVAPLIAIVVFINQLYRVAQHNLSPWKGGGMGMFSTMASSWTRFAKIYLDTDSGRVPAWYEIQDIEKRRSMGALLIEPNQEKILALQNELLNKSWGYQLEDNGQPLARVLTRDETEAGEVTPIKHRGVTIQIWQLEYEPSKSMLSTSLILESD